MSTFVITETSKFSSLDPLDGDSSQNLPVARMLYATPIEINADNTLGSRVLESFGYDRNSKTIHWTVRSGVTFSDGSPITADDIAFAVARMSFTRPKFPLIKLIQGVEQWRRHPEPLSSYPDGIKVVGNEITIQLTEDYPHPLFRFGLELFGIIPRHDVDPRTNKIKAGKVATSGYYEIKESGENSLVFQKRLGIGLIQGHDYPSPIRFLYRPQAAAFTDPSLFDNNTVILSNEALLNREQLQKIESKFQVGYTPAAWFTVLQINPAVGPFHDADCRLIFAEAFRQNFEKITGERSEGSIFTKIIAGYKTHAQLSDSIKMTPEKRISCLAKLSSATIPFGYGANTPESFVESIQMTAKELGVELIGRTRFTDRKVEVSQFLEGNSSFLFNRTGFWAMDPTGDIQMLFTPNLHEVLRHFWNDTHLQSLLEKVSTDGEIDMAAVDAANVHLFASAKLNVYSHIRRFYASRNKDLVHSLPIGITSPSPWHLFGGRQ